MVLRSIKSILGLLGLCKIGTLTLNYWGGESDEKLRSHVIEFPLRQKLADKLRRIIHDCHDFWEDTERTTGEEQETKKIKDQAQEVQKNILRKKFILCDKSSHNEYLQEHTHQDTLEYAIKQLEYTQRDLRCDQSWLRNKNEKERRDKLYQKMEELKRKHEKIVTLTRLLTLPNILDESPSTRDAGIRVALA